LTTHSVPFFPDTLYKLREQLFCYYFEYFYFLDVSVEEFIKSEDSESLDLNNLEAYRVLGEWLCKEKPELDQTKLLDNLDNFSHGGGSPTEILFKILKSSNLNAEVKELKKWAKKVDRCDLLQILNEDKDDGKISSLESSKIKSIANLLDKHIIGVRNWESLVKHFGLASKIDYIKQGRTFPDEYNPTIILLKRLVELDPDVQLDVIVKWAVDQGRNDVAAFLRNCIRNYSGNNDPDSLPQIANVAIQDQGFDSSDNEDGAHSSDYD